MVKREDHATKKKKKRNGPYSLPRKKKGGEVFIKGTSTVGVERGGKRKLCGKKKSFKKKKKKAPLQLNHKDGNPSLTERGALACQMAAGG